jgi:hypothetical protein
MARGPLTFRKRDLVRALKRAAAAGIEVARAEIDKAGKIVLVFGKPSAVPIEIVPNPWDEVRHEDS